MKKALYFILFLTASLGLSEEVENSTQLEWWETTLLYQIYPRSFKDSNADGIGDLKGICEKLDYVKSIGVDAIWIQPFYKSPMFDMGYDVEDYKAVDPTFGTIEDFKELQKAVKDRGMKLILDYVPNHTSDKCEWFKLSERRIEPYTDYYIWKDPKRINDTHTTVPNNWKPDTKILKNKHVRLDFDEKWKSNIQKSIFPGSMWTWSDIRKQYYLHQFSAQQPDLNYRNPKVKKEMEGVLRFWLDLGADGFRVDAVSHLYEAAHFMDEPPSLNWDTFRIYTFEQPECVDLVKEWRAVLDEYSKKDGKPRTSSRLFDESVDVWNMWILLLPGLASIYYGTELGMGDLKLRKDQQRDAFDGGNGRTDRRDSYRGPMLWDGTENAGFTASEKPWLPVHPNYWHSNVKAQQLDPNSHLNTFKRLTALRKTPVITHGDFQTYKINTWVYMFTRSLEDETVAVLLNIGSETEKVCVKNVGCALPSGMSVLIRSENLELNVGEKVFANTKANRCIHMRPHSGLVLGTSTAAPVTFSICILLLGIFSKCFL